jgi:hypothetical protein
MSNPLRSLDATTQVLHDIAVSIQALSPQRQNGSGTGGTAPNHPVDRLHCDGYQSSLRLDGEFLGSAALFTVDQNLSHPPHLFNGIEVRAVGRPMRMGIGHCDTECIQCFFRLF